MMIKISSGLLINADNIKFILAYNSNTSKTIYKAASEKNALFNLTKGHQCRSLIVMNDRSVIATDVKVETLQKKFTVEKEN